MLPHSAVTLLNGSTVWRALATYSCLPGHGESVTLGSEDGEAYKVL